MMERLQGMRDRARFKREKKGNVMETITLMRPADGGPDLRVAVEADRVLVTLFEPDTTKIIADLNISQDMATSFAAALVRAAGK